MVKTTIVNVVATASLCQELDLGRLNNFNGFSYNPEVYGGNVAYFKVENMTGRVSVFSSGKLISVGTKNPKDTFNELQRVANFLLEGGIVKNGEIYPEIRNIVVTVNLEQFIILEEIAEMSDVIYEPEQFPGVILRLERPYKASILIFSTGKIVIVGLISIAQIEPTVQQVLDFINNARK